MLDYAVLMYAGLVRKRIRTDDRLVRLHRIAGDAGNQLGSRHDLRGVNARIQVEYIATGFHRHHDFFQRNITGTFAQTIDGAFHLARTSSQHEYLHAKQYRALEQCTELRIALAEVPS